MSAALPTLVQESHSWASSEVTRNRNHTILRLSGTVMSPTTPILSGIYTKMLPIWCLIVNRRETNFTLSRTSENQ